MIKFPQLSFGLVLLSVGMLTLLSVLSDGCVTSHMNPPAEELAGRGPVIMNPKSSPQKLELNEFLKAKEPLRFSAEIMDAGARVTEAKLQIANTGIVVPLFRVEGTSWGGELSPEQIRELAINGRSIEYVGRVIAKDQNGAVNISDDPVVLAIATPPATRPSA